MERLVCLHKAGQITGEHISLVAECCDVSSRTVQRWLSKALATGQSGYGQRSRFEVTAELRVRLAYWRGNVSAVHRELAELAANDGVPAPSLPTLLRAVRRDLTPGERAGYRVGERGLRDHYVYLRRPPGHRNEVWEADHLEAPLEVELDGVWRKPWVTWFIDCATNVICGLSVSASYPNRQSIIVALRAAIECEPDYPFGGLPSRIRVDRGRDFLSKTVSSTLQRLAVIVEDLPGYSPYLKGTVESLNGAFVKMRVNALPRARQAQLSIDGKPLDPDQPGLTFEAFVAEVLQWAQWWNNDHRLEATGSTPAQAWNADPTPIHQIADRELHILTLEEDGVIRKITKKGVRRGRNRYYSDSWMTGRVGESVTLKCLPNNERQVEVFSADNGRYLGSAFLSDQATPDQRRRVRDARARQSRQLLSDLRAAERIRRERYAAVSTPVTPPKITAITADEARHASQAVDDDAMARLASPIKIQPQSLPRGWVLPRSASTLGIAPDAEPASNVPRPETLSPEQGVVPSESEGGSPEPTG
ncbi:Mu transposase C-terminal domain-containing protein [Nonomuraea sp. NPDC050310]|uniref:Mu transposase C-terminal domain-containing protein n=1 Tax=Nonomuraea sp. NPDC050310 TaxID=3154935 RepID=UPI0033EC439B